MTEGARRSIGVDDVLALGDVDEALGDFYDSQVVTAASISGVDERVIREWIETELITEQGFRGQAMEGPGPDPSAVPRLLQDAHLLRAESRRGASWYEISHDRMVEPALTRNERWRARNLNALQVEAAKWEAAGRTEALLLRGEVLSGAETWASEHEGAVLEVEREFLNESVAERERVLLARRRNRRDRLVAIAAVLLMGVAAFFWFRARAAEEQANEALLSAEAAQAFAEQQAGAALLAEEAALLAEQAALDLAESEAALRQTAEEALLRADSESALRQAAEEARAEAEEARIRAEELANELRDTADQLGETAVQLRSALDSAEEERQAAIAATAAAELAEAERNAALQELVDLAIEYEIFGDATETSCAAEPGLRSVMSDEATPMQFRNNSAQTVQVHWLDYSGERVLYHTIAAGQTAGQGTFVTHPWVVTDTNGTCLTIFEPKAFPVRGTIG